METWKSSSECNYELVARNSMSGDSSPTTAILLLMVLGQSYLLGRSSAAHSNVGYVLLVSSIL